MESKPLYQQAVNLHPTELGFGVVFPCGSQLNPLSVALSPTIFTLYQKVTKYMYFHLSWSCVHSAISHYENIPIQID